MGGDNPVLQGAPSVISTAVTIPALFVQRSTGLTLAGATPPVTALAAAVFDGWGFMRIYCEPLAGSWRVCPAGTSGTVSTGRLDSGCRSVGEPATNRRPPNLSIVMPTTAVPGPSPLVELLRHQPFIAS
jgi:hypothetical protein